MARLKRKKFQSKDSATTNKPAIDVYIVYTSFFTRERQDDAFKAK